jgi:Carboxypeptidase regulatory-like domain
LPFPFTNQVVSRPMNTPGVVNLKCNGGHVWMNAEVMVVSHPYYTVTDENGKFKLTGVPPGQYEIVAWHEGWSVTRQEGSYDVLTEKKVDRPVFSDPRTWEKNVSVASKSVAVVNFTIGEK